MDFFSYRDGQLFAEDVPVEQIARKAGTPCYIYSEATLLRHFGLVRDAFAAVDCLVCYSVKANSSLAILNLLGRQGSGFDIVSGGELHRVLKAGGDPARVVYASVGKTRPEIESALKAGILMFNVESESELRAIDDVAGSLGKTAPVALRVNPDVDPKTHKHTTTGKKGNKFGIDLEAVERLIGSIDEFRHVKLMGIDTHLGSPINTVSPYVQALEKVLALLGRMRSAGRTVEYLDIGGGFGIEYKGGETATPAQYAAAIVPLVKKAGCKLIVEPGRLIVGNSGILLARVVYVKKAGRKTFVITDTAMNDLIRPALYGSFHKIWPVRTARPLSECLTARASRNSGCIKADIVGPVCESGDFLAKGRVLPQVNEGDLLCVFSAGAYGMSMSSNYNSRPRAAEIMVSGSTFRTVRRRETYDELLRSEMIR